ncbi:MAG: hypothetical protein MUP55_03645, partial [Candidatus Aenigmarchaeota archaeon]|nr:hypothetical protein [Candidatus Aenigmarchaeota archaeon]
TLNTITVKKKGNKFIVDENQKFAPIGVKVPMPHAPDITIEPGVVKTKGGTMGLMPRRIEYPADKYSVEEVLGHVAYMNDMGADCPGCQEIAKAIDEEGILKKERGKGHSKSNARNDNPSNTQGSQLRLPPILRRRTLREMVLSRYG